MKVSLRWLNRYLDRPIDADEADHALTRVGFPIESRDSSGGDDLLDVEVTSNRGDCLCHIGIAREIAAATGRKLVEPNVQLPQGGTPVASLATVENRATDVCPLYTARVVTGVRIGPSPAWLAEALQSVGLRPVNNVVDATNFVLMELGQPLHAFDLRRLDGRRIVVRRAAEGEPFTAIDGSKHTLTQDMLVVADAKKPVALAGIMGRIESEVADATTDILLESAAFDPLSVRTASRALKLASDSSYRFERGIDPRKVGQASDRACQLIIEVAGGVLAAGVASAGDLDAGPRTIVLRPERCAALLGEQVPVPDMSKALERLGMSVEVLDGSLACTVPTFRLDLGREVDLIEEIARARGFERLPKRDSVSVVVRPVQPAVAGRRALDEVLVARGYHEAITPTFLSRAEAHDFARGARLLSVDPQRRKADPCLRPSVLPSLLACRKLNHDRGNAAVKLYEVASVWPGGSEKRVAALLADAADVAVDLRQVKGTIAELVERLGGELSFEPTDDERFEVAASVTLNGQVAGVVGVLRPSVVAAEVELEPLLAHYPPNRRVGELPRFPGIERDLSIVVPEEVAWARVEAAVRDARPALLESLDFVGIYRGKQVEKGRKSVTVRLRFRDPARTLKHDEVDPQVAAVVEALRRSLGAELRA